MNQKKIQPWHCYIRKTTSLRPSYLLVERHEACY